MRQKKHQKIALSRLELNDGQLSGLPKNPRFIRDSKFEALVESIRTSPEFLDARPLIVYPMDNGQYITLCGNMRLRACREVGFLDVSCYVLPKNTPIEKLREYTIKDNMSYGEIDWDSIANDWDMEELKEWDFDLPDWTGEESGDFPDGDGGSDEAEDNTYSRKIEAPTYEPTGEEPAIGDCVDTESVERLLAEIDNSNVSEEQKTMLRVCAYRHARINFENMAEYYAHQGEEMQNLMESNALVVIDYDKALQNGFVEMTKRLLELAPDAQEADTQNERTDYDEE